MNVADNSNSLELDLSSNENISEKITKISEIILERFQNQKNFSGNSISTTVEINCKQGYLQNELIDWCIINVLKKNILADDCSKELYLITKSIRKLIMSGQIKKQLINL